MQALDYKEVPISAAKRVAEEFDKDQVIIVTWDNVHQVVHVTTYGTTRQESVRAAQGGNFVKEALGWPDRLCHDVPEWYKEETGPRPTIVCLCGSTRFWRTFQQAGLQETLAGKIVLSIGAASGTDDEHFGNLNRDEYERVKSQLDELHLRKIDLADEVLVLNVNGYIGESTRRELEYAERHHKIIRFWEAPCK